jgi:hypothetical protein
MSSLTSRHYKMMEKLLQNLIEFFARSFGCTTKHFTHVVLM